ncbi:hypothetical protein Poli38472_012177 [Pythium oligandrum]|uniref:BED-type domain-containing protein n=1 Tax=Pythium oligandrum TaxID=41045 RepID=A0A8K1CQY7_PYTOL|nr:hypothetical protein Poli38472_012177 [Pythium oligandrum]|eukprot:TMW67061.1 hypothetical protein Poli38472_012177 [Pythium oligandrum]
MGRGRTMDEWVHFEKIPDEGRVPNSSYWYVHCRHCVRGFEQKQLVNAPTRITGRRSAMRAHLKVCPMYSTQYKMEQRALAAAAAAAAATAAAEARATVPLTNPVPAAAADETSTLVAAPVAVPTIAVTKLEGSVGEKRKRRGDEVEVSGPRGGRGKHCMMEEWDHFIRLQDEGYIGKSNFFFAVCRYCHKEYEEASEEKKAEMLPPEKLVGRREKMRKHLSLCPYFKGELPPLERRAAIAASGSGPSAYLSVNTPEGIKIVPTSVLMTGSPVDASALGLTGATSTPASVTGATTPTPAVPTATTPVTTPGRGPPSRLALDEWQFFTRLQRKPDSAYYFARCNFCQQAYENAPEALKGSMTPAIVMGRKSNMQTHLARCPYLPNDTTIFGKTSAAALSGLESMFPGAKRLKSGITVDTTPLFGAIMEVTIQHRLPFDWVDSASAKKLFKLGLPALPEVDALLPTADTLRGQVLDEYYHNILSVELEKLKQTVSFSTSEPGQSVSASWPVVLKVSAVKAQKNEALPSLDCTLSTEDASVPILYLHDRKTVIEDDLVTGISDDVSLSYYHGLDVARWIDTQLRQALNDEQVTTGVVVLPPSPVNQRAVGVLRSRWPNVVFAWNFEDLVTYCLLKVLQDSKVIAIADSILPLWDNEEVKELLKSIAEPTADFAAFADFAQAVLSEVSVALPELLGTVDRDTLSQVSVLLRAFAAVNGSLITGRVSFADALTHLGTLYHASAEFPSVREALEAVWAEFEQPLCVLGNAMHPHYRMRSLRLTDVTKLSALSDSGVTYFTQFFSHKPVSLRGDLTAYLHTSQHVFSDAFISEFPVVDDYYRYLSDNYGELAALMRLTSSFSAMGSSVKAAHEDNAPFDATLYTEDERHKLATLEERWSLHQPSDKDSITVEAQDATTLIGGWMAKLEGDLQTRLVDFSILENKESTEDSDSEVLVADESALLPLPSQATDDLTTYPSTSLKGPRSKKIRLDELFSTEQAASV